MPAAGGEAERIVTLTPDEAADSPQAVAVRSGSCLRSQATSVRAGGMLPVSWLNRYARTSDARS